MNFSIVSGKTVCARQSAAAAGLNIFRPMPPHSFLTNTMANTDSSAGIQSGAVTGRPNAMSSPVTAAEKSTTLRRCRAIRSQQNSAATANAIPTAQSTAARAPKM